MSNGPTRRIVQHGEVQIEVYARGTGARIVMLPSLGRGATDFDEIAERIAASGYRVLCPQPRGIGASRGPLADITLHDYAGDVAAVIDGDGGGPSFIAGHAFGNFVARAVAADHPQLTAPSRCWPPRMSGRFRPMCAIRSTKVTRCLCPMKSASAICNTRSLRRETIRAFGSEAGTKR